MPGVGRRDPEQGEPDVRPTGADETGKAEDLARAHVERDIAERPVSPEAPDVEDDLAGLTRCPLEEVAQGATDHLADGDRRRQLHARSGRDPSAVAEHGHAIGDLEDLFHPMRDEQDRDTFPPQGSRRSRTAVAPRGRTAKPWVRP